MSGSYFYSVKDLSKAQNRTIAFYLRQVALGIENFKNYDSCQKLYTKLVEAFDLKEHSKMVIQAVIDTHIKTNRLTMNEKGKGKTPYKEDMNIGKKSGKWKTRNEYDANLVRAVFAGSSGWFPWIVAFTFFVKPDKRRKYFDINGEYNVESTLCKADCLPKDNFAQFLVDEFNLSELDAKILNVAYLRKTVCEFNHLFDDVDDYSSDENRVSFTARCLRLPVKQIVLRLRNNSKLISYGLVDEDGDITYEAKNCIFDKNISSLYPEILKADDKKDSFALSSFSVKNNDVKLASKLLKSHSATNLLLYGGAGTGKTQFARSLVHSVDLNPLFLKNDFDSNKTARLCELSKLLSLPKNSSVIIVDEAECILEKDDTTQKSIVKKMLEESRSKVIWILHSVRNLDESILRYLTYSIKFNEMSPAMLKTIANTKLNRISKDTKLRSKLVNLCEEYRVTGPSMENIVKAFSGMKLNGSNEEQLVRDMKSVLESNSALFCDKQKMRGNVNSSYDISVLNVSIPAQEIVDMVMNAQYNEVNGGIRMLFYGLSGTGKTELARYIAEKLNKRILLKRASDILGMYVGDEEKNIKRAFEDAESSGDILLFDEADTFFADRSSAAHNWERSMVNEFLTQMEEFSGILICTTNLRQIMDPAMQRRFHILTEFKALRPEGIAKLLKSFFGTYTFDDALISPLVRYSTVTPGDFGSLAGKIRFMPQDKITPQLIIDELCKIQEEKGCNSRSIGFAG